MIKIGDRVITYTMPLTSHYTAVIGKVAYVRNGFVGIDTDSVMDRWSREFDKHECTVATAEQYVKHYPMKSL